MDANGVKREEQIDKRGLADTDLDKTDTNQEPVKKVKSTTEEEQENIPSLQDFKSFKIKNILNNSADYKRAVVEAVHDNGETAVIILDKKPFTEELLKNGFFTDKSKLRQLFQNDIYGSYDCLPLEEAAEIKSTVILPATQKHIDKYTLHPIHLIEETKEIYNKVTLPYILENSFSLEWVYNCLEHKKEAERILYEDPDPEIGFIFAPDLKWDGVTLENLYCSAIVHKHGIKSLRDLTGKHIPLLENILTNGCKTIAEKFGLSRSQLRIYIHYQPSYYHLHVHFNSIKNYPPGILVEKAHLLNTVIDNLKRYPNYYQEATLPFTLKIIDPLYKKLQENGYEF